MEWLANERREFKMIMTPRLHSENEEIWMGPLDCSLKDFDLRVREFYNECVKLYGNCINNMRINSTTNFFNEEPQVISDFWISIAHASEELYQVSLGKNIK